jgi:hypothetical protein
MLQWQSRGTDTQRTHEVELWRSQVESHTGGLPSQNQNIPGSGQR